MLYPASAIGRHGFLGTLHSCATASDWILPIMGVQPLPSYPCLPSVSVATLAPGLTTLVHCAACGSEKNLVDLESLHPSAHPPPAARQFTDSYEGWPFLGEGVCKCPVERGLRPVVCAIGSVDTGRSGFGMDSSLLAMSQGECRVGRWRV